MNDAKRKSKDTNEVNTSRREVVKALAVSAATLSLTSSLTRPLLAQETPTNNDVNESGRSVLITGCSSGFGNLMALTFARAGWVTVASMRLLEGRNAAAAQQLREVASSEQLALHVVEIDVDVDELVNAGVNEALILMNGRLDLLVNNAAFSVPGPLEVQSPEVLGSVLQTNLLGSQRMLRATLPTFRGQRSGLVVNISSGTGRIAFPGPGAYVTSKWALEGFTSTLRYELAPLGVEVCIVEPDNYPTRFSENQRNYWENFLSSLSVDDRSRLEAYGEHIERYGLGSQSSPPSTLNPQDVPDAVLRLANMAPGSRPLRTVVGSQPVVEGIGQINAVSEQVDLAFLSQIGLGDWLTLSQ